MKIIITFLILMAITCFIVQEGKISIGNERAGVFFLKGGYRAYWIVYSHGLKYPYRPLKDNLWCKPYFSKCDVRPLLKKKVEEGR